MFGIARVHAAEGVCACVIKVRDFTVRAHCTLEKHKRVNVNVCAHRQDRHTHTHLLTPNAVARFLKMQMVEYLMSCRTSTSSSLSGGCSFDLVSSFCSAFIGVSCPFVVVCIAFFILVVAFFVSIDAVSIICEWSSSTTTDEQSPPMLLGLAFLWFPPPRKQFFVYKPFYDFKFSTPPPARATVFMSKDSKLWSRSRRKKTQESRVKT